MLNPKLATVLPCNVDLETPIPSPFYFLSTCGSNFHNCVVRHLSELSSLVCFLSMHDLWTFLPYSFPLCVQVRFPPMYFHSPFHFLFVHKSGSSQFDSNSPLYATSPWFPKWSSNACANVLQVWQGPILEIERSLNLLSWNFLFKFFLQAKGMHNLMFGSYILMSLWELRDEWGGAKSKHIAITNIFVKTFAFVIVDQITWNYFLVLIVCFLISSSIVDDIGYCLMQV